jgi:hypothetical protein
MDEGGNPKELRYSLVALMGAIAGVFALPVSRHLSYWLGSESIEIFATQSFDAGVKTSGTWIVLLFLIVIAVAMRFGLRFGTAFLLGVFTGVLVFRMLFSIVVT